jgi:predicted alpha-1,2-mannosidase
MEESRALWGPVSTTLEYALADAALARLAEALGHAGDAQELARRAQGYRLLYDARTGLLRPRNADGSFPEPFDPDALEGSMPWPQSGGPGYVEGSAWNYAFFVPHDTPGLIALHGPQAFVERLQWVLDTGRFSLWNEPDIAYPYLFDYVPGAQWRTQRAVREAMARFFGTGPDGIPGNDDTGTLSAWFVFSALGLYPDAPGIPRYALGSPLFAHAEIDLQPAFYPGTRLVIEAIANSAGRPRVARAEWNGTPLEEPFLDHWEIARGGVLRLPLEASP